MKKKPRNRRHLIQLLLLFLLFLFVSLLIGHITGTVRNSMEREQMLTLETVSGKITDSMSDYFSTNWNRVNYMAETMQFETYDTVEDALKMLDRIQKAHGLEETNNLLLLVDDTGYYYTAAAGKVALWQSFSSTIGTFHENETVMLGDLAELKDHQERYICFVKQLDHPIITADGNVFSHIVMAADETVFDIDLSLGEFGNVADAFVMANNGRKISNQGGTLDISHSHNLLVALKDAEFLKGDSYEQMIETIQKDESGVSLIRYSGNEYYIAYHALGIQDWNLVFIVGTTQMADRLSPVIYQLVEVLFIGFSILTLIIVAVIRKRNQEHRANDRLRAVARIAEQSNKMKSDFLSRMSHDIRTPLSGIISWTDVARNGMEARDCDAVSECLDNITVSSEYLLDIVNEVLDMSQLEHGGIKIQNAPLWLDKFLDSAVRIIRGRAEKQGLFLLVELDGIGHPYVLADRRVLNHILLNILGNAVKYTPAGGSIRLTAYDKQLDEEHAEYHFIVADTGIGMSPEFLEHIFDRFAQEETDLEEDDTARTRYLGVGLGMAITKELVDQLSGQITVESKKNVGSTFEVILTLPLCKAPEKVKTETADGVMPGAARRYHVILAEDVPMNRKAMVMQLERVGITCRPAEDGVQAVEIFAGSLSGEYDAILMDVMMPNMDGHEAARTIRSMERPDAGQIPIFALSANAYPEDLQKSTDAGMNLHLTKPLVVREVLEALNRWCDKEEKVYDENKTGSAGCSDCDTDAACGMQCRRKEG